MVRRKEFSLKFTDSLLLAADSAFPDGTYVGSTIADDIFNDPEAWSDSSLSSAEGDEGLTAEKDAFPQNVGGSRFVVKPFMGKPKAIARRPPSILSPDSPLDFHGVVSDGQLSPVVRIEPKGGKDRATKRMSIFFSHGNNIFRAFPSPPLLTLKLPNDNFSSSRPLTPLTAVSSLTLRSPATATAAASPMLVSASATWSFLQFYGGEQPDTPGAPRTAGLVPSNSAAAEWMKLPPIPSSLRAPVTTTSAKSATPFLVVPNVPPTPTKYVSRRRPLPSVPSPLPLPPPPCTSPPEASLLPRPAPRGARAPSPSPVVSPPAPPPYEQQDTQRNERIGPSAVPRSLAPIAWLAS